jgi:dihydropteroate synthase
MLVLKEFGDKDHFYRFLKDKVGVFFREAEQRSYEGIHRVLYFENRQINPQVFFECARQGCLHAYQNENRFALSGTEAQIKEFWSAGVFPNSTRT